MTSQITDEELERLLANSPAERITTEYMESRIKNVAYLFPFDTTTTICHITLDNGYVVIGSSACVNPANYDKEIGKKIAYQHAFGQLWDKFGFLLAEKNHLRKLHPHEDCERSRGDA